MKVDICSIMYNEELLLSVWIESWLSLPFINKIYLVDGGSTDKSVEIAKNYDRVEVVVVPWKNDFARQRNIALKFSKSDIKWIIQPDIDELPCGNIKDVWKIEHLLNSSGINQLIIPYIKFYDWNRLWFFKNNVPALVEDNVFYAVNKSTTTIFKKDHLRGYTKKLHEMPIYSGPIRSEIFSLKKEKKIYINDLEEDFFLGHYDQAKHFEQARRNGTTVEYEMGLKRARYRLIFPATYNGKVYNKRWAEQALRPGNEEMIEELGTEQFKSFLDEHNVLGGYDASHLNNNFVLFM